MDVSLKRIVAYLIDFLIIFVVASALVYCFNINQTSPVDYEKYANLITDYRAGKVDEEIYQKEMIKYNYESTKDATITSITTIVLIVAYFGFYQVYADGQTIGKKFLKIKLVAKDGSKVKYGQSLLRLVILYNIIFRIMVTVGVYFMNAKHFYTYNNVIGYMEGALETVILVMVILRQDGRGLHDILAKTKVVSTIEDVKESPVEEIKPKEIIEVPVKESKTTNKKKTTAKTKVKNTKK